jgi:hypothetical protein
MPTPVWQRRKLRWRQLALRHWHRVTGGIQRDVELVAMQWQRPLKGGNEAVGIRRHSGSGRSLNRWRVIFCG